MSLYDDLDTKPDADQAELKAAYRRKAKRTHPDTEGGDREAFERVNRAWLVLGDPTRRERYDATGETDAEPDNKLGMVASMMSSALDAAMQRAQGQFEHYDLVQLMMDDTREKLASVKREIRKGQDAVAKHDKLLERAGFKGKGQNLLAGILKDRRASIAAQVRAMEQSRDGFELLIQILPDYDWTVDQSEQLDLEAMLGRRTRTFRLDAATGC